MRKELPVQGADGIRRRLHRAVVRKHVGEAFPIGADCLLVLVAGFGVLVEQVADAVFGRRNAVDAVQRHDRLLPRNLDERIQHLVLCVQNAVPCTRGSRQ